MGVLSGGARFHVQKAMPNVLQRIDVTVVMYLSRGTHIVYMYRNADK